MRIIKGWLPLLSIVLMLATTVAFVRGFYVVDIFYHLSHQDKNHCVEYRIELTAYTIDCRRSILPMNYWQYSDNFMLQNAEPYTIHQTDDITVRRFWLHSYRFPLESINIQKSFSLRGIAIQSGNLGKAPVDRVAFSSVYILILEIPLLIMALIKFFRRWKRVRGFEVQLSDQHSDGAVNRSL